ncbi:MAG TPA: dTMP kinase [Candidatus Acidoferrales bacterium]|nr:dTMP kinase [Candidatus Acidoferrales bacterium]
MAFFITFEGGDGTGKSTQLRVLETYLSARGKSCLLTREPGGTPLGKLVRQVLLEVGKQPIASPTELFLYLADRAQHMQEVVAPALAQGKIVLCDRHTDSTLAYQGFGRGIDIDLLRRLNAMASGGIKPDLTILFDCPVEIGLSRTRARRVPAQDALREDRFEREELKFHERVRTGFLELARAEPERFHVIDASLSIAEVQEQIRTVIDRKLG